MNKVLQLDDLIFKLSDRMEKLEIKSLRISTLVQNQNNKFEKLWKGYKSLGLLENLNKNGVSPITREIFNNELLKLQDQLDEILQIPPTINNKIEIRNKLENHLIVILGLLNVRWGSIVEFHILWSERRNGFRKEELRLQSEYEELVNESKIESFILKTEFLAKKHTDLINKQLELISAQDDLFDEMERIYNIRENLFKICSELFII
jgi:hypothetical protein